MTIFDQKAKPIKCIHDNEIIYLNTNDSKLEVNASNAILNKIFGEALSKEDSLNMAIFRPHLISNCMHLNFGKEYNRSLSIK